MFRRNSHFTLYIYLLLYFASILYIHKYKITLRHCLETSFFQRFRPLQLLYVNTTSCLMDTHLKS